MRWRRTIAFLSLAVLLTTFGAVACSGGPEEAILQQFFRASRLGDNTSLAGFAVTRFDPKTQGTIASFDIVSVSPEERTPLALPALAREHDAIRNQDLEFTKRKDTYFLANTEAITRVLKAESARAKVTGKDAEVQAEWAKLRDESAQFSKRISEAQRKLKSESVIVELSLNDPAKPVDITKHDGEIVSKNVTITAPVRLPDGTAADRTLVVNMRRAVLKSDPEVTGKWVVTSVRDASASPAETKTS